MKTKICVIQNIFVPDETIKDRSIRSIRSLKNISEYDLYFIGWCKDEYWDEIRTEIRALSPKNMIRQDKNYGKAHNINELSLSLNYDYMLTMDSDIVFLDDVNYYHEIQRMTTIDNMGVIAFNQLEGNCHLIHHLVSEKIINDQKYIWNNNSGGIAGGCLLINFEFWKQIKGYKVMGVYAGDDAYLFMDAKKRDKFFALNTEVSVIHPIETNDEYQQWKIKVCQRDSNGINKIDINSQIEESNKFWDV